MSPFLTLCLITLVMAIIMFAFAMKYIYEPQDHKGE